MSKNSTRARLTVDQALDQNPDTQETVVQETENKKDDPWIVQNDPPVVTPPPLYSPVIAAAILDLARATHEELAGPGAVSQALALWQQSGWSEAHFVAALQNVQGRNRKLTSVLATVARQIEGEGRAHST